MHTCTHAHMHTCTHAHMHTCTHARTHTQDVLHSAPTQVRPGEAGTLKVEEYAVQTAADMQKVLEQMEDMRETMNDKEFDLNKMRQVSAQHVAVLEQQIEHLTAQCGETATDLEEEQFAHRQMLIHSKGHVRELETEVQELHNKLDAGGGVATKANVLQEVVTNLQKTLQTKDEQLKGRETEIASLFTKVNDLESLLAKAKEAKSIVEKDLEA